VDIGGFGREGNTKPFVLSQLPSLSKGNPLKD
jgi:hypothetical protein